MAYAKEVCYNTSLINIQTEGKVNCQSCPSGYFYKEDSPSKYSCEQCVGKLYSNSSHNSSALLFQNCEECEAGSYLVNGIELKNFESFPSEYNFTTKCIIKDSQFQETDCLYSKGFIPVYEKGLIAGINEPYGS